MGSLEDRTRSLLAQAYHKLSFGEATSALEDVVAVLKLVGGDAAVLPALQRAKENFSAGQTTPDQLQQLSNLFGDISLEAEKRLQKAVHRGEDNQALQGPLNASSSYPAAPAARPQMFSSDSCILQETGREAMNDCAVSDGSSYVCEYCGAVVTTRRRQAHIDYWCEGTA